MLMMKYLVAVMMTVLAQTVAADTFDFNSQRGEVQRLAQVPGFVVDRTRLPVLNPTPASSSLSYAQSVAKADTVVARSIVDSLGAESYSLEIKPDGRVIIAAGGERGLHYANMTWQQLLEQGGKMLPTGVVNDHPALPIRGVVEGFYGTPWSHATRLSLIDFYGRHKLNTYIYGPKDDPYHSSPYWRLPYPAEEAAKLRELVEACRRNQVDFTWAIHPGKDIRWTAEDYDSLRCKLEMMHSLGVRSFALFFDDIEGIGTNPVRQAELVNRLTHDFVEKHPGVKPLMICPTDYSQMWANPGENGTLAVYGRELQPEVEVMWTGEVVCSDLTPATLEFINSRIKRPALFWWNFPVTDYCREILLQGPVYGLDTSLSAAQTSGIVSNPMEHGEASKLALYGVADYAWNPTAYNPLDNWHRGLQELMPECAEAYGTLAIHSADTETGYRRDESWLTTTFNPLAPFTTREFEALQSDFEQLKSAPAQIRAKASNRALVEELDPWLTQAEALGQRGLTALQLINTFHSGSPARFWRAYLQAQMTPAEREAYKQHRLGTLRLQPFYEMVMDRSIEAFYEQLTGQKASTPHAYGSYKNLSTVLGKQMLDADSLTYWTSAYSQQTGDRVGVDLGIVKPISDIRIRQGRNSVDDVDYFDHALLEVSADGENWQALGDTLRQVYDVQFVASHPIEARYVTLRKLPSAKTNWMSIRTFEVNRRNCPDAARDGDLTTALTLTEPYEVTLPTDTRAVTLLTALTPYRVQLLNRRGKVIATQEVTDPYLRLPSAKAHRLRLIPSASLSLHEILFHR